MAESGTALDDLIALSHHLGEEWREYVIVGEGNTSARADEATFWVKASGASLRTIDEHGFVRLHRQRLLDALETAQSDEDVTRVLNDAQYRASSPVVDPAMAARPSIESFLHAIALSEGGAHFVGHTHPVAINAVLCSQQPEHLTRHIMPDEIIVCGIAPVWVPYVDPGLPLAREVRAALRRNIAEYGEMPKVIYLQNHGMLALGQTAHEVENITAMAVKNARVVAQTAMLGGPRFLSERDVRRIHTRPDEEVRKQTFMGRA